MNTLQCLQCPVCTLFLHAGMSLESHLETHPKEQVIKALVQLACSTKCPEVFVSPPTSAVQRNVMIVNSTQYYRNDRRSQSSFISCNNSDDEPDDDTISENHQKLSALSFNSSVRNNVKLFPTSSIIPLTSETQLPPPPYTTAIEENSTFSSNFSNFQQQQHDSVNFHYSNENYDEVEEGEEEVDLETKQLEIDENSQVTTAQYFEKENGDFILHENPTSNAEEYTEEENGEFLLREKIIEKAPSVLHFNDEDKKPKDFSGLKVLSDVPVRVTGSCSSSTGSFIIEYQNENNEPEINPFKSVIRTATNDPESSTSEKSLPLTRHSTKFFLNKQPKKLIVKFKKPVYQTNSDEIQVVDEIDVEKKSEEISESKVEEKIFSADEKHRVKYHKRKNHLLENFRKDECIPIELEESIKDESPVTAEVKPESSLLQLLEMTTEEECVSDYIGPFTPLSSKFDIEENNTENENTFKNEPELQIIEEILPISIVTIEEEPKEIEQGILSFGISSNNIKSENWLTKTEDETIKEIPIDAEEAGPSNRIDYSFPNLFANEQFLYSPEERNRVPNILEFNQENDDGTTTWHRQTFSPQYVTQFENDRNSYMDLDACKTNNSIHCDQAASVDSLNIRTDEKMPAKGEISEQESNGDNGEGSWNNQV